MTRVSFSRTLKQWGGRFALGLGVAGVLLANAWLSARPAPEGKTGLPVGRHAPEFKLADQTGQMRSLSGLLKQGPVAVVFYRSADW